MGELGGCNPIIIMYICTHLNETRFHSIDDHGARAEKGFNKGSWFNPGSFAYIH